MEQHLGHRTYAANARSALMSQPDLDLHWIAVEYHAAGNWLERLPVERLRSTLAGRREVGRGLRAVRPDVCVYNTQVPAVIGPAIARRAPFVLCTDVTPLQYDAMAAGYAHRADRPGPARWAKHRWNRRVFHRAAAHAPWSSWVRRSLIDDYAIPAERIEVIPPGVDTARWPVAAHHGSSPVRLLFVGGDFVRKGGELLLHALATLPTGAAELHVVTRSDVPRQDGVVVHHGLSPNDAALAELFRASDVFVLPSQAETFGIAAVEAAATGLPLVVADVGGLGDLVVDGVTGFAVEPSRADAIAVALRHLVTEPELRRALGAAARRRAEAEFDSSRNAERLLALAERAARAVPEDPGALRRRGRWS